MKIAYAYPVDSMLGRGSKLGGIVFTIWNGITVGRIFVPPRNPQTNEQNLVRADMTACSKAFSDITVAQKTAWQNFSTHNRIKNNGADITLPAYSLFTRINCIRLMAGKSIEMDAPTAQCDFAATVIGAAAYNHTTTVLTFSVSHSAAVITSKFLMIKITDLLKFEAQKVSENSLRMIGGLDGDSFIALATSPQAVSITAPVFAYTASGFIQISVTPISDQYVPGTEFKSVVALTYT